MNKKLLIIGIICLIIALGFSFSLYDKLGGTPDAISENKFQSGNIGQGEKSFELSVIDLDDKETKFTVHTDKETVGEALVDAELISGEPGPYGMYVKTVNGTTLDYDINGKYWAFYINGEYSTSGVDKTIIEKDTVYTLIAE